MNKNSTQLFLLQIIAGLLFVIYLYFYDTGEVTVYTTWNACVNTADIKNCPIKENTALSPIIYKASSKQQTVIFWFDDGESKIYKLNNCAVKDKENWTCIDKTNPHSVTYTYSMTKGQYKEEPSVNTSVSFYHWWMLRIKEKFSIFLYNY
jgi:hypothetical protein